MEPLPFDLGPMDNVCPHCGALKFRGETASLCCHNGNVDLEPLTMPDELRVMAVNTQFQRRSRQYSSCFAISSIGGVRQDRSVNNLGTQTYRVSGRIYHRVCPTQPRTDHELPRFAQTYFTEDNAQDELRAAHFQVPLDQVRALREMLQRSNPYVRTFRRVRTLVTDDYKLVFHHFDNRV